jgi:hypothetical protein
MDYHRNRQTEPEAAMPIGTSFFRMYFADLGENDMIVTEQDQGTTFTGDRRLLDLAKPIRVFCKRNVSCFEMRHSTFVCLIGAG